MSTFIGKIDTEFPYAGQRVMRVAETRADGTRVNEYYIWASGWTLIAKKNRHLRSLIDRAAEPGLAAEIKKGEVALVEQRTAFKVQGDLFGGA